MPNQVCPHHLDARLLIKFQKEIEKMKCDRTYMNAAMIEFEIKENPGEYPIITKLRNTRPGPQFRRVLNSNLKLLGAVQWNGTHRHKNNPATFYFNENWGNICICEK